MKALRVSAFISPEGDPAKQENNLLTSGLFTSHKVEERLSTVITKQETVKH